MAELTPQPQASILNLNFCKCLTILSKYAQQRGFLAKFVKDWLKGLRLSETGVKNSVSKELPPTECCSGEERGYQERGLSQANRSSETPTSVLHLWSSGSRMQRITWKACSSCRFWGPGLRESDSIDDVVQDSRISLWPRSPVRLMEMGP